MFPVVLLSIISSVLCVEVVNVLSAIKVLLITVLKVFIHRSKLAGIRLETWDPNVEKNKIYEYAKSIYWKLDAEVKENHWIGYKDISSGGKTIYYSKYKEIDGTYETLDISTEELIDLTIGEDVVQANN